jgi:hypothetical protein
MQDKPKDNKKMMTIDFTSNGAFDVRLLKMARRFPYMFKGRHHDLIVNRYWIHAFEQTCVDIDNMLGQDKCGFRWTELTKLARRPYWHWELGDAYNLSILLDHVGDKTTFRLVDSALDPGQFKRDTIHLIVDRGICSLTNARVITPRRGK